MCDMSYFEALGSVGFGLGERKVCLCVVSVSHHDTRWPESLTCLDRISFRPDRTAVHTMQAVHSHHLPHRLGPPTLVHEGEGCVCVCVRLGTGLDAGTVSSVIARWFRPSIHRSRGCPRQHMAQCLLFHEACQRASHTRYKTRGSKQAQDQDQRLTAKHRTKNGKMQGR